VTGLAIIRTVLSSFNTFPSFVQLVYYLTCNMHTQTIFTTILASVPLIAAHGKVPVMTGDLGGNGTALGIQGAVVADSGPNKATELDTTVFKGSAADACGRTNAGGVNNMNADLAAAMALSGPTLPQVSKGGSISGTLQIVTTDGAGPYACQVNTDGTMQNWQDCTVETQVPGRQGNIRKTQKRWIPWVRDVIQHDILRRATNVNEKYPIKATLPPDAQCVGKAQVNGQNLENLCVVKLINPSNAGPFGGCVPVQMPPNGTPPSGAPASPPPSAPAATKRKAEGRAKLLKA
jgi:hypothetical protein